MTSEQSNAFSLFSKIKAIEPKNPHIIYELYRARSGGFFILRSSAALADEKVILV